MTHRQNVRWSRARNAMKRRKRWCRSRWLRGLPADIRIDGSWPIACNLLMRRWERVALGVVPPMTRGRGVV